MSCLQFTSSCFVECLSQTYYTGKREISRLPFSFLFLFRCRSGMMIFMEYFSYCTLFDHNYIYKGILTVNSLIAESVSAKVYILCMDELTFTVLSAYYSIDRVMPIRLEDFLDDKLRKIRAERSRTEFCWSCSAFIIDYVFRKYHETVCTYIDSDMFFYANPDILVEELLESGKSVQIVEHRFTMNDVGKDLLEHSGKFCVEFNTFCNNDDGLRVLRDWEDNIIQQCTMDPLKCCGDQLYLNEWPEKYSCIHILTNVGAGVAPWNIDRYKVIDRKTGDPENSYVAMDGTGKYPLVFYHFHALYYIDRNTIKINVFNRSLDVDKKTVYSIYIPYIERLLRTEDDVKKLSHKLGISIHDVKNASVYFDRFQERTNGPVGTIIIRMKENIIRLKKNISRNLKELKEVSPDHIKIKKLDHYTAFYKKADRRLLC